MRPPLNPGYAHASIRTRFFSFRVPLRLAWWSLALLLGACLLCLLGIGMGDFPFSPGEVLHVLGGGETQIQRVIVTQWYCTSHWPHSSSSCFSA